MKKTFTFSLLTITAITFIASALYVRTAAAKPQDPRQAAFEKALGAELEVPEILPAGINDAILMEAWIRLYNQQEVVTTWNGSPLTGRELAQFALEAGLPVVWDINNLCKGGSCSNQSCLVGTDICDYDADGQPGIDPIFIAVPAQPFGAGMVKLVSTLAHEIYHRTAPFGNARDTQYEEYWASYVGEKISHAARIQFGAYDPLQPAHLTLWIKENRLDGYFTLAQYPAAVAAVIADASAEQAAAASANVADSNVGGLPTEFFGGSK